MVSNNLVLCVQQLCHLEQSAAESTAQGNQLPKVCGSATRCPNQANKNEAVLLQTCLQCSLDDSPVHFRKEFV